MRVGEVDNLNVDSVEHIYTVYTYTYVSRMLDPISYNRGGCR